MFPAHPADTAVLEQVQLAAREAADDGYQLHGQVRVIVPDRPAAADRADLEPELLPDLAGDAGAGAFAGVQLSTGELPLARAVHAGAALRSQDATVALDDRAGDPHGPAGRLGGGGSVSHVRDDRDAATKRQKPLAAIRGAVRVSAAMSKPEENLLVVERRLIEGIGMFQGLCFDVARYTPLLLDPRHYRFVPRSKAENDPSIKQIIPYFIITHGGQVWCYVRGKKSGEERLVAKASIGIGGHINNLDENLFGDVYSSAALRELEEEVKLAPGYTQRIVALLNDDSNSVGQVHLGVVHVLRAVSVDVSKREGVITESGFRSVEQLRAMRDRLETWSQLCLGGLDRLLAAG